MFDLLLFSGCVFISFYVPYAKLNWAQEACVLPGSVQSLVNLTGVYS